MVNKMNENENEITSCSYAWHSMENNKMMTTLFYLFGVSYTIDS